DACPFVPAAGRGGVNPTPGRLSGRFPNPRARRDPERPLTSRNKGIGSATLARSVVPGMPAMPHSIDVLVEQSEMPLTELAERSGLSVERIESIVDGRWTPSPDDRHRLAVALGLD